MTTKYLTRPSPPYPAKEHKNSEKLGNNGELYVSIADKNGVYKWVKVSNKTKKSTSKKLTRKSTSRKSSRKPTSKKSSRKSTSRKSSRKPYITIKKCKEELKNKIKINMLEYKEGKFVNRKQAIAVSYNQIGKKYPNCKKRLSLKKN